MNRICLVVPSLKCKEHSYRPKYATSFFTPSHNKRTHKPSKVAAAKNSSSNVYVIGTTCVDECFYSIWWLEVIVFCKTLSLFWDSSSHHIVGFFETSVFKEVCFTLSLQQQCSDNTKLLKKRYRKLLLDETFITYFMVTFLNSCIL